MDLREPESELKIKRASQVESARQRAKDRFLVKVFETYYADHLDKIREAHPEDTFLNEALDHFEQKQQQKQQRSESTSRGSMGFLVTINPTPDWMDPDDFFEACHKAFTKKWITDCVYTFEYYTKTTNHWHCHGYVCREDKPPSEIQREFRSTFKDFIDNNQAIHFKWAHTLTAENNFINYVAKANPTSEEKAELVHKDQQLRIELGLNDIYRTGKFKQQFP